MIVGGNGFSALSQLQCLKSLVIGGGKMWKSKFSRLTGFARVSRNHAV